MNCAGHCQRQWKTDRMAVGSVELEMVLDLVGGRTLRRVVILRVVVWAGILSYPVIRRCEFFTTRHCVVILFNNKVGKVSRAAGRRCG
jgi:hypothetical protein